MTQNPYRANYGNLNLNIFYATVLRRHWLDFNNFGCFEKVWTCILHFWYQCRHCNDYDYHYQWLCSLLKKIWKNRKSQNLKNRKFSIRRNLIFFDNFFLSIEIFGGRYWQILTLSDPDHCPSWKLTRFHFLKCVETYDLQKMLCYDHCIISD